MEHWSLAGSQRRLLVWCLGVWFGLGGGGALQAEPAKQALPWLLLLPLRVSPTASGRGADAAALHGLLAQRVRTSGAYRLLETDSALQGQLKDVGWDEPKLAGVLKDLPQKPEVVMSVRLGNLGQKWLWEVQLYNYTPLRRLALREMHQVGPLESLDSQARLLLQDLWAYLFCQREGAVACFVKGLKHDTGTPPDFFRARLFYHAACNLNAGGACQGLGVLYGTGQGVSQDYGKAHSYYAKGCNLNEGGACQGLGFLYEKGQGVSQDYGKAHSYYAKGCNLNAGGACQGLGFLYEKGQGVSKDCVRAKELYQKACKLGRQAACAFTCH